MILSWYLQRRTLKFKGTVSRDFLLLFFFLDSVKIFCICHWCQRHRWQTLSCEYLCGFSKKFEMAQMVYSGAWGKVIHEKNKKSKISWHCPFKCFIHFNEHGHCTVFIYVLNLFWEWWQFLSISFQELHAVDFSVCSRRGYLEFILVQGHRMKGILSWDKHLKVCIFMSVLSLCALMVFGIFD